MRINFFRIRGQFLKFRYKYAQSMVVFAIKLGGCDIEYMAACTVRDKY